jgi:nicotinamidase-related amidase
VDPFDIRLDRAAFVIVDMQNDFVRVGAPLEVPDARTIIAPILKVLQRFRASARGLHAVHRDSAGDSPVEVVAADLPPP